MNNEWYNNEISKKLYNDYPHNFSVCDIDGVCRKFYRENKTWKTRLVIWESKHLNESISQTQLGTLYELDKAVDWAKFDEYSGVFVIRHNFDLSELMLNVIINTSQVIKPKFELEYTKSITMNAFYEWISAAGVENN